MKRYMLKWLNIFRAQNVKWFIFFLKCLKLNLFCGTASIFIRNYNAKIIFIKYFRRTLNKFAAGHYNLYMNICRNKMLAISRFVSLCLNWYSGCILFVSCFALIRNPELLFIFLIWHRWFLFDSKWVHYCEMIVNDIGIECVIEIYVRKEIIVRLNTCWMLNS